MRTRIDGRLAALVALAALLFALPACSGKRPPALAGGPGAAGTPGAGAAEAQAAPAETVDQGPDVRAVEGEGAEGRDLASGTEAEGGPLADIRFELDSSALTDAARGTLEQHALWLQGRRDVRVTIEGHCDERGTVEYNLALGEQRARAARDYLVSLGVAPERLRTVSYGKERPLDPAPTEAAYARNRRARFAASQ
jgi:peptidoglycan-associated lipoprotein